LTDNLITADAEGVTTLPEDKVEIVTSEVIKLFNTLRMTSEHASAVALNVLIAAFVSAGVDLHVAAQVITQTLHDVQANIHAEADKAVTINQGEHNLG